MLLLLLIGAASGTPTAPAQRTRFASTALRDPVDPWSSTAAVDLVDPRSSTALRDPVDPRSSTAEPD